jgi:hypothetical protein
MSYMVEIESFPRAGSLVPQLRETLWVGTEKRTNRNTNADQQILHANLACHLSCEAPETRPSILSWVVYFSRIIDGPTNCLDLTCHEQNGGPF